MKNETHRKYRKYVTNIPNVCNFKITPQKHEQRSADLKVLSSFDPSTKKSLTFKEYIYFTGHFWCEKNVLQMCLFIIHAPFSEIVPDKWQKKCHEETAPGGRVASRRGPWRDEPGRGTIPPSLSAFHCYFSHAHVFKMSTQNMLCIILKGPEPGSSRSESLKTRSDF